MPIMRPKKPKCKHAIHRVVIGLALMVLTGNGASGQFTHGNFQKPRNNQSPLPDFWTNTPQLVPKIEPGQVNSDPTVQIENPEIQQVGFYPPQRSLFPDTSPGRLAGEEWENSVEDGPVRNAIPMVWGGVGARIIPVGQKMAPNGVGFDPLFSLDLELNIALCHDRSVYLFSATRFWGQKAAPNITNSSQGPFDFSKREFDLTVGAAWNYWRTLEIRGFVYSYNNLNRGRNDSEFSASRPYGYNDGGAVEHRWYYFDSCFAGVGYAPTKELIGNNGLTFKPGWFLTSSIWAPLWNEKNQLYWNASLIGENTGTARMLYCDIGYACVPFARIPRLEFRTGTEVWCDLSYNTLATYYLGLDIPF